MAAKMIIDQNKIGELEHNHGEFRRERRNSLVSDHDENTDGSQEEDE